MILTQRNLSRSFQAPWLLVMAVFLLSVLLLYDAFPDKENATPTALILCDAEATEGDYFVNNGHLFSGANLQVKDIAHSGKHSIRLAGEDKYGFTYVLKDVSPHDRLHLSVWKKPTSSLDGATLALAAEDINEYYVDERIAHTIQADGWQKMSIIAQIPEDIQSKTFKVYVYITEASGPTYFDDLLIEINPETGKRTIGGESFDPERITLSVSDKGHKKLVNKKWEAVAQGNLFTSDQDWVKATFQSNSGQETEAEIRLKGDWLDHLAGDKWSFRVKLKGDAYWNRLKVFSFQNPRTRSHLLEWFYHQWMLREDVLCPRYDFLHLSLNDKDLGVYAIEEHFTKLLVENRSRREGPIIKFSEDAMWLGARKGRDNLARNLIPEQTAYVFKSARIVPFVESKTFNTPSLFRQFEEARNLLTAFKDKKASASEVFDIQMVAKWIAISDILDAHHSLAWHNLRFYYNPVISKLEPVGFDGFGVDHRIAPQHPFFAYHHGSEYPDFEIHKYFFDDADFMNAYVANLKEYTDEIYIKTLLADLQEGLKDRENFIRTEFPDYQFDTEAIFYNARRIRTYLYPLSSTAVQAYRSGNTVRILNGHALPITLVGYYRNDGNEWQALDSTIHLMTSSLESAPPDVFLQLKDRARAMAYKVIGLDSVFRVDIQKGRGPEPERLSLRHKDVSRSSLTKYGQFNGNTFTFSEGAHRISEDIILPKQLHVRALAGTTIDLVDSASFISYSPIEFTGTSERPVIIRSSDNSATGFTVLQAGDTSQLLYCQFDGLSSLIKNNWALTGAVTFYESPVLVEEVSISNNSCEDALNIIRSYFICDKLSVSNTAFDGFDADFCRGAVKNSRFQNIGNDALDFSGSVIAISRTSMRGVSDKGISAGENSQLVVRHVTIEDANLGLASKDLSVVNMDSSTLSNCMTAFTAFQKKPEFGPGKIEAKNIQIIDCKFPSLIEDGATLTIDGKLVR